ncbi:Signal transduction histidine kinase [Spirosomataceae bacterium TFI 002]|nr:Signal transduction histidine kinase [Spirosomataceae bacterium TFI 002]
MRKVIIFLLLSISHVYSQGFDFRFYSSEDGLPTTDIRDLNIDKKGFIWFNLNGLYRFDGNKFLGDQQTANSIFGKLDKESKLVLFENQAYLIKDRYLNILNTVTGVTSRFSLDKINVQNFKVDYQGLNSDSKGNIYVTTSNLNHHKARLYRFTGNDYVFIHEFEDFSANKLDLKFDYEVDSKGNIYYNNIDKKSVTYFNPSTKEKKSFSTADLVFFSFIARSNEQMYWVCNNLVFEIGRDGLIPSKVNEHLDKISANLIRSILVQENGDIWLSGGERELLFFNNQKNTLTSYKSAVYNHVSGIVDLLQLVSDRGGNIWIQTYRGLLKITPKLNFFDSYFKDQKPICNGDCSFRGFTEDPEGNIYAGFYNNIATISPTGETNNTLTPNLVRSHFDILYSNNQMLLENADILDLKTKRAHNIFKTSIHSSDLGIYTSDTKGNIWYANVRDFYQVDVKNKKLDKQWVYSGDDFKIEDIKYDKTRNLVWIATGTSLFKYSVSTKRVEEVNPQLFRNNKLNIKSLELDRGEILWLATDEGLVKYDLLKGTYKIYTTKDGLCSNFTIGILSEADSCLWISTNNGLTRFSKSNERFINFFEEEGIAKNEFNRRSFYKAKNGKMFFGGVKGVTSFFPKEVMEKYQTSQKLKTVNLASYSYYDSHKDSTFSNYFVSDVQSFEMESYFNNYTFTFSTLDFREENSLRYRYMLEGFDNSWSEPQKNASITFNSLPAGNYTLRIKAIDINNRALSSDLILSIKIYPPWYWSWWAILIYIAIGLLLLAYLFKYFKKNLENKQATVLKLKEAEQAKVLENFKSRFFTNITHEFRTPLTVILGMADNLKANLRSEDQHTLSLLEANSQKLLLFVNQLLDLSKLENASYEIALIQGDIVKHSKEVLESFAYHLANSSKKRFAFESSSNELIMDFDRDIIQKALINLVGNAFKFTQEGDEITVKLKQKENFLLITISDTGTGINTDKIPFIFDRFYQAGKNENVRPSRVGSGVGLAHTQELITLLNGTIEVKSSIGKGTSFIIKLPIQNNASFVKKGFISPQIKPAQEIAKSTFEVFEEDSQKKNLLIVEDDADLAQYLTSILNPIYNIQVARNGQEGVNLALANIPDLIISDVMMPIKDGFELCDELKNNILTSHIPLTLLTAKSSSASRLEGLRYGANAYLSKPFVKEELLLVQQNLLNLRTENKEKYNNETIVIENEVDQKFLKDLKEVVSENLANDSFGQKELGEKIGMSHSQLYRKLNGLLDTTPGNYIKTERLKLAANLLQTTSKNISEIAFEVGFSDAAYFTKTFKQEYKKSPSAFRKLAQSNE